MKYVIIILLSCFQLFAFGQGEKDHINAKKGLAIEGYDPVSYYSGKPVEGNEKLKASYHGVTYYFSSEKNRGAFKTNPQKYEPAYGGWCAYAMGETGEKVKIDPETYKIIDNKIYLFYNFWGTNTLDSWNSNESGLKIKADENWNQIIK